MVAAEIRFGDAVLSTGCGQAELMLEDVDAVEAGDAGEAVEENLEVWVGGEEGFDERKVEDGLEHGDIVGG